MKAYIKEIENFAGTLTSLSTWKGSKKPFGHITGARKDYVYEFWCCVKLLEAIHKSPNQKVELFQNTKKKFPKAPALKNEGWSYFYVNDKKGKPIMQVCPGTAIARSDAPDSEYHPDISFQGPKAGDEPTEKDVHLIMDAKFQSSFDKSDEPGSISLKEINAFSHLVNVLKLKNAHKMGLDFGKLSKLKGNSIISNANVNKKHDKACEVDGVKQVGNFDPAMKYKVIGK